MANIDFKEELNSLKTTISKAQAQIVSSKSSSGEEFSKIQSINNSWRNYQELINMNEALVTLVGECGDKDDFLLPLSYKTKLVSSLEELQQSWHSLFSDLTNFTTNNGSLTSIQKLLATASNGAQFDLDAYLRTILERTWKALECVYPIYFALGPKKLNLNQGIIKRSTAALAKAEHAAKEGEALLEVIKDKNTSAAKWMNFISEYEKAAHESKLKASSLVDEISTLQNEALQNANLVSETLGKANELDGAVSNYKSKFDKFDSALVNRESTYLAQKKQLESLLAKDEQVSALVAKSRKMLGLTTEARLSATFRKSTRWLELQAAVVFGLFIISIGALTYVGWITLSQLQDIVNDIANRQISLATAVAGVNAVATVTGSPEGPANVIKDSNYSSSLFIQLLPEILILLYRVALIVPAAWLAIVLRKTFNTLHKLKHHYEYKATVAASVEGFREQIDESYVDLRNNMVIQAYEKLLELNPALYLDGKPESQDDESKELIDLVIPEKLQAMFSSFKDSIVSTVGNLDESVKALQKTITLTNSDTPSQS